MTEKEFKKKLSTREIENKLSTFNHEIKQEFEEKLSTFKHEIKQKLEDNFFTFECETGICGINGIDKINERFNSPDAQYIQKTEQNSNHQLSNGENVRTYPRTIKFNSDFLEKPKVIIGLTYLDVYHQDTIRLYVQVTNVSLDSFSYEFCT